MLLSPPQLVVFLPFCAELLVYRVSRCLLCPTDQQADIESIRTGTLHFTRSSVKLKYILFMNNVSQGWTFNILFSIFDSKMFAKSPLTFGTSSCIGESEHTVYWLCFNGLSPWWQRLEHAAVCLCSNSKSESFLPRVKRVKNIFLSKCIFIRYQNLLTNTKITWVLDAYLQSFKSPRMLSAIDSSHICFQWSRRWGAASSGASKGGTADSWCLERQMRNLPIAELLNQPRQEQDSEIFRLQIY